MQPILNVFYDNIRALRELTNIKRIRNLTEIQNNLANFATNYLSSL